MATPTIDTPDPVATLQRRLEEVVAERVLEYNPYHEEGTGKFTTRDNASRASARAANKANREKYPPAEAKGLGKKLQSMVEGTYSALEGVDLLPLASYVTSPGINDFLRKEGYENMQPGGQDFVREIDAIIDAVPPLPEEITVYRGGIPKRLMKRKGTRVTDEGFMSTSPSHYTAERNFAGNSRKHDRLVAEIILPKGARGIYVNEAAKHTTDDFAQRQLRPKLLEQEFLLARGTTMVFEGWQKRYGSERIKGLWHHRRVFKVPVFRVVLPDESLREVVRDAIMVSLREYNKCHDPKTGRFAKGPCGNGTVSASDVPGTDGWPATAKLALERNIAALQESGMIDMSPEARAEADAFVAGLPRHADGSIAWPIGDSDDMAFGDDDPVYRAMDLKNGRVPLELVRDATMCGRLLNEGYDDAKEGLTAGQMSSGYFLAHVAREQMGVGFTDPDTGLSRGTDWHEPLFRAFGATAKPTIMSEMELYETKGMPVRDENGKVGGDYLIRSTTEGTTLDQLAHSQTMFVGGGINGSGIYTAPAGSKWNAWGAERSEKNMDWMQNHELAPIGPASMQFKLKPDANLSIADVMHDGISAAERAFSSRYQKTDPDYGWYQVQTTMSNVGVQALLGGYDAAVGRRYGEYLIVRRGSLLTDGVVRDPYDLKPIPNSRRVREAMAASDERASHVVGHWLFSTEEGRRFLAEHGLKAVVAMVEPGALVSDLPEPLRSALLETPLQEYNPYHDPKTGKFTSKGKAGAKGLGAKALTLAERRTVARTPQQVADHQQRTVDDVRRVLSGTSGATRRDVENFKALYGENPTDEDIVRVAYARAEATHRHMVENSDVAVGMLPDTLIKVLDSGRIKNQHETGTTLGASDLLSRREGENAAFGYDDSTPASERPVYGALRPRVDSGWYQATNGYGGVNVILRDSVRDRTTYTAGDSLWGLASGGVRPQPLSKPSGFASPKGTVHHESFRGGGAPGKEREISVDALAHRQNQNIYWEAQIHGGVRVSDIARVVIDDPPGERYLNPLIERLEAAGIPYEIG